MCQSRSGEVIQLDVSVVQRHGQDVMVVMGDRDSVDTAVQPNGVNWRPHVPEVPEVRREREEEKEKDEEERRRRRRERGVDGDRQMGERPHGG